MFEKTISSKKYFQGSIFDVRIDEVALPGGKQSKREIVEHKGAVAIVPVDNQQNIICVKQYRKPAEDILLEIPAGKLENNEKPEDCAKRELAEETGFSPGLLSYICSFYPSPGYTNEIIHLYIAEKLEKVDWAGDEEENLEVTKIPLQAESILQLIQKGKIVDAKTILGLLYTLLNNMYK